MPKEEKPDPEHLTWLVKSRAVNQGVSAKLYGLIRGYPEQFGDKNKFGSDGQMLIAISFSLWRSLFLSDKTGYFEDTNKDAEYFLGEMLLNNAINFSQDRTARNWTFNYYAANAKFRLELYAKKHPDDFDLGRLTAPNPKARWEKLHDAFEVSVEHFGKRLEQASKHSD